MYYVICPTSPTLCYCRLFRSVSCYYAGKVCHHCDVTDDGVTTDTSAATSLDMFPSVSTSLSFLPFAPYFPSTSSPTWPPSPSCTVPWWWLWEWPWWCGCASAQWWLLSSHFFSMFFSLCSRAARSLSPLSDITDAPSPDIDPGFQKKLRRMWKLSL